MPFQFGQMVSGKIEHAHCLGISGIVNDDFPSTTAGNAELRCVSVVSLIKLWNKKGCVDSDLRHHDSLNSGIA